MTAAPALDKRLAWSKLDLHRVKLARQTPPARRDLRRCMTAWPAVYLMLAEGGPRRGECRLGYSSRPAERLLELEKAKGCRLTLLGQHRTCVAEKRQATLEECLRSHWSGIERDAWYRLDRDDLARFWQWAAALEANIL